MIETILGKLESLANQEVKRNIKGGQRYFFWYSNKIIEGKQSISSTIQQVAPKYSTVMKDGLPVTIKEQGLLGRLKGKNSVEI